MSLFTSLILLSSLCCLQVRMFEIFRSSYLKLSSPGNLDEDEDFTVAIQVHDEFGCASMCSSSVECHYVFFDKDSKKCSLVKPTEKLNQQEREEPGSQKILLEKVDIVPNSKQDCVSVEKDKPCNAHGNNQTHVPSCSSILQNNSSNPTGIYNITVGEKTWPRQCEMKGVEGCGNGAWELVMWIQGYRNKTPWYVYDSRRWISKKASIKWIFGNGKQVKFPAYWLSSFTRICVTMNFKENVSRNATSIVMNYTAPSLHSVLHSGAKTTWATGFSTVKTPPNIDKSCLVQGFNMRGPHPWVIKSRIGVETQPQSRCPLPYLVRGVGIGFQEYSNLSCGEIIISGSGEQKPKVEIYPALCGVYIQ